MSQMIKRMSVVVPVVGLGLAAVAGCSSSSSSSSPSPSGKSATATSSPTHSASSSATHSPSASPAKATCSKQAVQAVLPKGETVSEYKCADAGVEYWAAGTATKDGKNVSFFLKSNGGKWTTVPADQICGTASAGLPPEILGYCPG